MNCSISVRTSTSHADELRCEIGGLAEDGLQTRECDAALVTLRAGSCMAQWLARWTSFSGAAGSNPAEDIFSNLNF